MPQTSGPYTPQIGVPINISNPAAAGGNLVTAEAVLVNLSPYELEISAAQGAVIMLIDPFTRDVVPLQETGQQLTITPLNIGFTPPAGVNPSIYALWYGALERTPAALPAPIVPYGNLQQVNVIGGEDVESNGAEIMYATLPEFITAVAIAPIVDVIDFAQLTQIVAGTYGGVVLQLIGNASSKDYLRTWALPTEGAIGHIVKPFPGGAAFGDTTLIFKATSVGGALTGWQQIIIVSAQSRNS